jgi:hypothetical protein
MQLVRKTIKKKRKIGKKKLKTKTLELIIMEVN